MVIKKTAFRRKKSVLLNSKKCSSAAWEERRGKEAVRKELAKTEMGNWTSRLEKYIAATPPAPTIPESVANIVSKKTSIVWIAEPNIRGVTNLLIFFNPGCPRLIFAYLNIPFL